MVRLFCCLIIYFYVFQIHVYFISYMKSYEFQSIYLSQGKHYGSKLCRAFKGLVED